MLFRSEGLAAGVAACTGLIVMGPCGSVADRKSCCPVAICPAASSPESGSGFPVSSPAGLSLSVRVVVLLPQATRDRRSISIAERTLHIGAIEYTLKMDTLVATACLLEQWPGLIPDAVAADFRRSDHGDP